MSYCSALNYDASGGIHDSSKVELIFSPRVAAVMRQEAEIAACLDAPPDPTILLTSPRGKTREYNSDSQMDITWRSTRVSSITIEYSIDNGTTWLAIVTGLPVSPEMYSWRVPQLCTNQVLVRIHDASNPVLADSSLVPFAIIAALPTISRSNDTLHSSVAESYQWSLEGSPIAGAVGRSHLPLVDGRYSVAITDNNSCAARSAVYHYSLISRVESGDASSAGITEMDVVIEPATGQISIQSTLSRPETVGVTLFDSQGRRVAVLASKEHPGGSATMSWPIPALPSGSYILEIRAGGSSVTRKVVLRK